MNIQNLTLHNYRMFKDFELDMDSQYTLIVGSHGVGKSSILEAAALAVSTFLLYKRYPGEKTHGFNRGMIAHNTLTQHTKNRNRNKCLV